MNRRLEENNFEGIYEKIIGPSTYIYVENFKKISLFSNFFIINLKSIINQIYAFKIINSGYKLFLLLNKTKIR